jgi:hypothetical protein
MPVLLCFSGCPLGRNHFPMRGSRFSPGSPSNPKMDEFLSNHDDESRKTSQIRPYGRAPREHKRTTVQAAPNDHATRSQADLTRHRNNGCWHVW